MAGIPADVKQTHPGDERQYESRSRSAFGLRLKDTDVRQKGG